MDLAPPRGRLQLVGDLAQQLVAEPVAARRPPTGSRTWRVDERGERRVELVGRDRHRGGQQRAVDLLTRRGRGRGDRQGRRRRVEPGDERLVERLGDRAGHRGDAADPGRGAERARADELLEVERDPVAARGEGRRSCSVRSPSERVDERQAPGGRQRLQLDRPPRARPPRRARSRGRAGSPGPVPHQLRQQGAGRVVEPVQVLGHERAPAGPRCTGDDVVEHRRGRPAPRACDPRRRPARSRRSGRCRGPAPGAGPISDGVQPEARRPRAVRYASRSAASASSPMPQRASTRRRTGWKPASSVERRAVQLDDARVRGANLVGERGHQARLADAGVAADQDAAARVGVAGRDAAPMPAAGARARARARPAGSTTSVGPGPGARRRRGTAASGSATPLTTCGSPASISKWSSTSCRTSSETTTVPGIGERCSRAPTLAARP